MPDTLDPSAIIIRDRQRKKLTNIDEHFVNSVKTRLIHPIVIRRDPDTNDPVLVVGGRRLEALKRAQVNPLINNTHFRFFEDLTPEEARVVELEENVKREDLPWRDQVAAVGELHEHFRGTNEKWNTAKTAERLNITRRWTTYVLRVYQNIDSPLISDASSIRHAVSILQVAAERHTAQLTTKISEIFKEKIFVTKNQEPETKAPETEAPATEIEVEYEAEVKAPEAKAPTPTPIPAPTSNPSPPVPTPSAPPTAPAHLPATHTIINEDFIKWIAVYNGPKFNLIHCDFPYDIRYDSYGQSSTSTSVDYDFTGFWPLVDALVEHIDNILSYSSHIMFWFSMKFYQETKTRLEKIDGLQVHDHPFIWTKSDNMGIIPWRDNRFPRRIYETAFLCTRNKRPLVKSISNACHMPTVSHPIHPSQKPEPVLRYFFSGLIDQTTDLLDPTCGSGSSIRAAEDSGARRALGLELDKTYADSAESATINARNLRTLHRIAAQ